MGNKEIYDLMYPIGKYEAPPMIGDIHREQWIETIYETPTVLLSLIKDLDHEQLGWIYRPQGWSIAQVIHHMTDSHSNAINRFKLSLTEDTPVIKPYHEGLFAMLPDYDADLVQFSFNILEGVHAKWVRLLRSLDIHELHHKSYFHPELHENFTLAKALGLYDWHCRHHIAHIKQALDLKGVFE